MQRMPSSIVAVLALALTLVLTSCGQRGPLYLPKQDQPAQGNGQQK